MNANSLYHKTRMHINCVGIHYWGHLKVYARKYRCTYYRLMAL